MLTMPFGSERIVCWQGYCRAFGDPRDRWMRRPMINSARQLITLAFRGGRRRIHTGNVIVAHREAPQARRSPEDSGEESQVPIRAVLMSATSAAVALIGPPMGKAKTTPDLKIDQKANSSLDVAGDGQSATTRNSGESGHRQDHFLRLGRLRPPHGHRHSGQQ